MDDTASAPHGPKRPQNGTDDPVASRRALMNAIRARRRFHRNRVAEAISTGRFWEIVKAELARDYSSLYDNMLVFELELDETFARHKH